ncbi:MAG: NYN domain-containing protein [Candidatus Firestonebacteria bacterium]|nr:NYN domain-containing protein [Candidatus Firestonebacteria bacterium]
MPLPKREGGKDGLPRLFIAIMAKHLLVDGFNIIRRDGKLSEAERKNFYGAQELLIQRLAQYRRGTDHRVTLVFDGTASPNPYRHRTEKSGIEVIFSARGETADDVIKDLIAEAGPSQGMLVATADRDLAAACRSYGAGIIPPEELTARTRPRALPPPGHDFWQGKREEQAWSGTTRKKGNPRRLPKAKRRPSALW